MMYLGDMDQSHSASCESLKVTICIQRELVSGSPKIFKLS